MARGPQEYVKREADDERRQALAQDFGYKTAATTPATTTSTTTASASTATATIKNKFDKNTKVLQRRVSDEGPRRDLTQDMEKAAQDAMDADEEELFPAAQMPAGPQPAAPQPAAPQPAAQIQGSPSAPPAEDAFGQKMDTVLDKKFSVFAQDFGQALNMVEVRLGTEITREREERVERERQTSSRIDDVLARLEKLENKGGDNAEQPMKESVGGATYGWKAQHMILGWEGNHSRTPSSIRPGLSWPRLAQPGPIASTHMRPGSSAPS